MSFVVRGLSGARGASGDTGGSWVWHRWLALAVAVGLLVWGSDTLFRANGLYGERAFVTAPIMEKQVRQSSRSGRNYHLVISHMGERLSANVTEDEFAAAAVDERRAWVIVPGRFAGHHVYIDRPGLKLDPGTRVVAFGLIVGSHFLALLALFVWLVRRAERA